MRPEAIETMVTAAQAGFGNPTGSHHVARTARRLVDDARDEVADVVGALPSEIVFCGSGTEADNLAIFGSQAHSGGTTACAAVEHHAVLHPVQHLGGAVVNVDSRGHVDLDHLREVATAELSVLSVMLANNETGVIQPLEPIRAVLDAQAPRALLHTDAVQAFPWLDLREAAVCADLISLSGHKFGGPKGVGVLVVRDRARLSAQVLGGGQEFEMRSGTHNVAGIAAFGTAARLMHAQRDSVVARVGALRDRLVSGLQDAVGGITETAMPAQADGAAADRSHKVAGSAHLCFDGIESEALLFMLERQGLAASAASSCASGAQDPSHVLAAMGYSRELAGGSLRLSLGFGSTGDDVDRALAIIPPCVDQLRTAAA